LATVPQETVDFGPSLALAEKWANETGMSTERMMSDPLPDGTKVPLLLVTHGTFKVLVREQGTCVVVFTEPTIPDAVRNKLTSLPPEDKQRVMIALRGELSSNSSIGYAFFPTTLTSLDQLVAFSVQRLLKIAEDDIGCFNGFCDAIQGVITITVKAMTIFGIFVPTQTPSATAVRSAPATLYG
jgi:hypothetical protein